MKLIYDKPTSQAMENVLKRAAQLRELRWTPIRRFPPSLGGRTVGDHGTCLFAEKTQIIQRCEKPSIPRSASSLLKPSSNTIRLRVSGTRPLWRGIPNFSLKSLLTCAIGTNSIVISSLSGLSYHFQLGSSICPLKRGFLLFISNS